MALFLLMKAPHQELKAPTTAGPPAAAEDEDPPPGAEGPLLLPDPELLLLMKAPILELTALRLLLLEQQRVCDQIYCQT